MSVPYKISNKMTDVMLEVSNLDKKEVVSIAAISNQDFSEVTTYIFLVLQRKHAIFYSKDILRTVYIADIFYFLFSSSFN